MRKLLSAAKRGNNVSPNEIYGLTDEASKDADLWRAIAKLFARARPDGLDGFELIWVPSHTGDDEA